MNQPTVNQTPESSNSGQNPRPSPQAVLSVSREEFYGQDCEHEPLELIVKEGMTQTLCPLPDDLPECRQKAPAITEGDLPSRSSYPQWFSGEMNADQLTIER